ncbi:Oidioi.mRNA.OKI2018_I69.chr1.g3427.t1.cds [Oikopleura dioica]|uniref:Oidioi.mRNA.OKI2018_I69.chr1.g3427.t1.cds n=1 Tax=Oikopleura dioica TaxID=34765 RepID=A0ABN7SY05_OIKDI|nr:Oidioi.mRNA.OKI2018_I69.chr1.g3427.t1.cds [Oikopleura dioica]
MYSLIEKTTDYVGRYISFTSKPEYDEIGQIEDVEDELNSLKDSRVSSWYNHESEPLINEPEETKLKPFPAMALLVSSMAGIGVLSFPLGFVYAGGILNGILIQIPFLAFCWITINALGMIARKHNCDEYEDIVTAVLGSKVDKIIKVIFFIYSLGSSMAYFVVIIDQGKAFFDFKPSFAPLLCLLPFPFSVAKNVAFLKHTGTIAMVCMLVTCVITALDYFLNIPENFTGINNSSDIVSEVLTEERSLIDALMLPTATHLKPPSLSSMFLALPLFCFAYQASVKIYRRIERPKNYPWISAGSFLTSFVCYNFVGTFVLLCFGSSVNPDFLMSYPNHSFIIAFARIGTLGSVTGAYPVFALTARKLLSENTGFLYRFIFASSFFGVCLLGAIYCPSYDIVSGIIGSFAGLIMFVIPGVMMIVAYSKRKCYRAYMGAFFATFGSFLFVFSFIYNLLYR